MSGQQQSWYEIVKTVHPAFPEQYRGKLIDALVPISGDYVTTISYSAMGWILSYPGNARKRGDTLRLLLELGANPNAVCDVTEILGEEVSWNAVELAGAVEDALVLLEAGAVVRGDSCVLQKPTDRMWPARGVFFEFHQASLRATAVVWCLEALRGSSSWPDMSFLLTKIIMDVSK
jgi:hypothetical protein